MILGNQHRLEIVVNGEPLEFVSDDDLNLVFIHIKLLFHVMIRIIEY